MPDFVALAIDKIKSVLPDSLQREIADTFLFSLPSQGSPTIDIDFTGLRRAIRSKRVVELNYVRADGETILSADASFMPGIFSPVWLVSGWCEMRNDFRNFRLDRIHDIQINNANLSR